MKAPILHLFADATAKLEDLHAVAVEGQQVDNTPDMQSILSVQIHSGIAALSDTMRAINRALDCARS